MVRTNWMHTMTKTTASPIARNTGMPFAEKRAANALRNFNSRHIEHLSDCLRCHNTPPFVKCKV